MSSALRVALSSNARRALRTAAARANRRSSYACAIQGAEIHSGAVAIPRSRAGHRYLRQQGLQDGNAVHRRWLSSEAPSFTVVNMPALSPTMETGTITKWHAQPGTALAPGDVLCDVETDKATVAFEVQEDGVLAKILVQEGGGEVKVGSPVAVTVEDEAAYDAFTKADAAGSLPYFSGEDAPSATDSQPQAPAAAAESAPPPAAAAAANRTVPEEFAYSPAARHLAQSKGIDIVSLAGSGRGGRVTKSDLIKALASGTEFPKLGAGRHAATEPAAAAAPTGEAAAAAAAAPKAAAAKAPAPAAAAPAPASGGSSGGGGAADHTDIPANNIRKVIAKRLAQSKATVPHLYVSAECELDALLALRKELAARHGAKVSVNDLVIRAAALALRDVPEANAQWSARDGAAALQRAVDVSVAVATPTGLITPIVTRAAERGLLNISAAVRDLAGRAKEGKLKPEEFQGGTFTISNLGMFGIAEFSAVINPPQACIMAVGGGVRRVVPGARDAATGARAPPRVATVMTAKLSADRRVVDEAVAAQFLQQFTASELHETQLRSEQNATLLYEAIVGMSNSKVAPYRDVRLRGAFDAWLRKGEPHALHAVADAETAAAAAAAASACEDDDDALLLRRMRAAAAKRRADAAAAEARHAKRRAAFSAACAAYARGERAILAATTAAAAPAATAEGVEQRLEEMMGSVVAVLARGGEGGGRKGAVGGGWMDARESRERELQALSLEHACSSNDPIAATLSKWTRACLRRQRPRRGLLSTSTAAGPRELANTQSNVEAARRLHVSAMRRC
ncbi:2-oxoacid dehydrogenases acyltransferase-domain-containing protein [Tribonema minus]|uniref:Dihydrolipoamide acetyltransferase component of pyruvate dehydrogenase complex n=1 Tax=Tribonema minus TaxID=303371 RepID=A0A835ZCE2_9STRA|nr:2-oxoacid dehydrogenases acyltransferase-domain-containing protein [Tribonema minus]